ncbi:MAG TPA: hypothetical protein VGF18_09820 [Candidatus Tumulicola sp.]|jgi:hypothetical protein
MDQRLSPSRRTTCKRRNFGFGLIVLTPMVVAACGRQVTPNPIGIGPGGASEGYTSVFFDVAAPFNFSNYQYWIVFNTSGDGSTPSTQPIVDNWAGYSAGIEVTGSGASTRAFAVQFIKEVSKPHAIPTFKVLPTNSLQLSYNVDSNGSNTEFNVIFQRAVFLGIVPSPAPLAHDWTYNAFTTQANVVGNLAFLDSMGQGGAVGPQYASPALPTWQCFDHTYAARSTGLIMDQAAQIVQVRIANNPSPTPSVTPSAAPCN